MRRGFRKFSLLFRMICGGCVYLVVILFYFQQSFRICSVGGGQGIGCFKGDLGVGIIQQRSLGDFFGGLCYVLVYREIFEVYWGFFQFFLMYSFYLLLVFIVYIICCLFYWKGKIFLFGYFRCFIGEVLQFFFAVGGEEEEFQFLKLVTWVYGSSGQFDNYLNFI